VNTPFIPAATDTSYAESVKQTRRIETQRRHASKVFSRRLDAVQDLEQRLGIATRWVAGSEEWKNAAKLVSSRVYQRALDQLQGLIVARLFELSKMNMSGTGGLCAALINRLLVADGGCVRIQTTETNREGPPSAVEGCEDGSAEIQCRRGSNGPA
jgi:hypothetical protein